VRQDAPGRLQHRHPRHPKCRRGLGAAHQAQRLRARAEACAARAPLLVQTWQPRRGCQRQALRLQTRNASGAGRGHTACACSWHALLPAIPCSASHSSARREASVPVCVSWQCTGPRLVLQLCSAAHTGMVPSRMRGLACLPVHLQSAKGVQCWSGGRVVATNTPSTCSLNITPWQSACARPGRPHVLTVEEQHCVGGTQRCAGIQLTSTCE